MNTFFWLLTVIKAPGGGGGSETISSSHLWGSWRKERGWRGKSYFCWPL